MRPSGRKGGKGVEGWQRSGRVAKEWKGGKGVGRVAKEWKIENCFLQTQGLGERGI
jgi:hypothetical protein